MAGTNAPTLSNVVESVTYTSLPDKNISEPEKDIAYNVTMSLMTDKALEGMLTRAKHLQGEKKEFSTMLWGYVSRIVGQELKAQGIFNSEYRTVMGEIKTNLERAQYTVDEAWDAAKADDKIYACWDDAHAMNDAYFVSAPKRR